MPKNLSNTSNVLIQNKILWTNNWYNILVFYFPCNRRTLLQYHKYIGNKLKFGKYHWTNYHLYPTLSNHISIYYMVYIYFFFRTVVTIFWAALAHVRSLRNTCPPMHACHSHAISMLAGDVSTIRKVDAVNFSPYFFMKSLVDLKLNCDMIILVFVSMPWIRLTSIIY